MCCELVDASFEVFGGRDVLVNNAVPSELVRGPDRAYGSVADLTTKQLEALWTPALYGYIWGCRFGSNQMIKQGRGGSVVNISSTTSFQSMANMSGYLSSNGAMNSTTRSLAAEYGHSGTRVTAVVPGHILTTDTSKAYVAVGVIGPRESED